MPMRPAAPACTDTPGPCAPGPPTPARTRMHPGLEPTTVLVHLLFLRHADAHAASLSSLKCGQGIGAGFNDNGDCARVPRRITHAKDFVLSKSAAAIFRPKRLQSIADRLRIVISHLIDSSSDRHISPYDDVR